MTCIVGIEHEGSVWLGGDAIAIESDCMFAVSVTEPKVFLKDGVGFGFCGSFRTGQLLKYALNVPEHPRSVDDMTYLVVNLVDSMRECMLSRGSIKVENSTDESLANGLIAYAGQLYYFDEDFQIGRTIGGYIAQGAGQAFAMGALTALEESNLSPQEKILIALQAAEKWCPAVKGPFTVLEIPNIDKRSPRKTK